MLVPLIYVVAYVVGIVLFGRGWSIYLKRRNWDPDDRDSDDMFSNRQVGFILALIWPFTLFCTAGWLAVKVFYEFVMNVRNDG